MSSKEPEKISPDNSVASTARSAIGSPSFAADSMPKSYSDTQKTPVFVDTSEISVGKIDPINEKDRLSFAKQILFCLFLLVLLVFLGSYITAACFSSNSELIKLVYSILDITKTAVPAIVTLVLGFYFGKST